MIFNVENIEFSYNKQVKLLKNISFSAEKGEVLAIIGANGAGKTTLLKCLLGINEYTNGSVFYDGTDITKLGLELYKHVAFVPQAKQYTTSFLVEDMILIGRNSKVELLKQPSKEDLEAVEEVIKFLQIEKLKGKTVDKISGGELQMVLIARALVSNPKVLILDEPESNLDWYNQLTILGVIEKMSSEGITCIFNTHYPEHALRLANKTLMLKNGEMIGFGDSFELITTENLRKLYSVETHIDNICVFDKNYPCITSIKKV